MAVDWSTPELAARYSRYVEEVRDFLATSSMHCGSADDLAAVAIRIDAVPSFREDLTSLVRAIILREGGFVPRTNLLEILAMAIGGSEFDQAGREIQQPLGSILAFINNVMAKPWNQPPGESRLKPEIVAGPREVPPPASREQAIPPPETLSPDNSAGASPMEGYGAMLSARHKVVPISTRRPIENHNSPSAPRHSDWQLAAGGTLPPPEHPEGMFSRLSHVARQADTRPGPNPAPAPVPDPVPPPHPPPVASALTHLASTLAHLKAIEPYPTPHAHTAVPTPAVAAEIKNGAASGRTVFLSSSAVEDATAPPIPTAPAPKRSRATLFFSKLSIPKIPVPHLKLPKFSAPRFPVALSKFAASRVFPVVACGVVVAAVTVFAVLRGFVSRAGTGSQAAAHTPALPAHAATSPGAAASKPVDTEFVASAPTAAPPAKPSAYGSPRYDDYVAPPYSRPIPGQPDSAVQPKAGAAAPVATPLAAPPTRGQLYGSELRPASYTGPAPIVRIARPVNPDATYVGASAEERAADAAQSNLPPPRRRPLAVSSGVMRGNLLSAPAPGYPLLAKIAHLQGQVVVEALVGPDGHVSDTRVLSGHHLLRGAAEDAVRRWRYRPYVVDGRPQQVSTTVTLDFPEASQREKSANRTIAIPQQTRPNSVRAANSDR